MNEKAILEKYNINIKNTKLLNTALTHSSYANENNTTSYERLEYLGDAVLEIVCSEYLFNNTNYPEGEMSRLRSLYVCENALYEYSRELNLSNYIRIGNGVGSPNKTIIADVFESLMAVIYIEFGLSEVKRLFNELIVPYINRKEDFLMDYKSLLQEYVQTIKKTVTYNLISEEGPAHDKTFKTEVLVDGESCGVGVGNSKKEAEQNAAKDAYLKMN